MKLKLPASGTLYKECRYFENENLSACAKRCLGKSNGNMTTGFRPTHGCGPR